MTVPTHRLQLVSGLPAGLGANVATAPLPGLYENGREPLSEMILRLTDWNHVGLSEELRRYKRANYKNIARGINKIQAGESIGLAFFVGLLYMKKIHKINADGTYLESDCEDFGLVSCRLVTNAGVGYIVDAFQNLVELESMRYHGIGTGATAEAQGDTALVAELSTVYQTDNTRATGTLTETSANIYRTVGTNTVDGGATIVEHGLFSQAANSGGVLLDRSVFGGIVLVSGNALQSTYDFTITAGG